MTALAVTTPAAEVTLSPPLRTGDRLKRDEFERRYQTMPGVKAELIEGVVYVMSSPVSNDYHAQPHADIMAWLGVYRARTPGVGTADNGTVRLDWDNEPQPDGMLRILPEYGGQSRTEGGYVTLAPELAVEVSASSASIDLHDKKNAYRRNGVREYIVWRTEDSVIDWFVLRGGEYESLEPADDGILRSEVFPGLWLDAAALLSGNLSQVLDVLEQGLASPEHLSFVERMQSAGEAQ